MAIALCSHVRCWKGAVLVERFPPLAKRKSRIHGLLERYDFLLVLTVRFLYGLRIAGPLIMEASKVLLLRFAVFNVVGPS